jgi:WD40 domain-containing protein
VRRYFESLALRLRNSLALLALGLWAVGGLGCARAPKLALDTIVDAGSEVCWLAGDSLIAVALLGRGVAIVDAASGEERAAWRLPTLPPHAAHGLAVSAGGETLAVATGDSVRLLRARDGAQLMAAPGGGVALALSGDGGELAWSDGTFGRVLETRDGRIRWQGGIPADRHGLAWSPASGAFAWTDARRVRFLGGPTVGRAAVDTAEDAADDIGADSALVGELGPFMEAAPTQLAFSASGYTLAVTESTEYLSFWDTRKYRMSWRLKLTGRARVGRVALSADARYVATAYEGRTRLLWAYTGRRVADWSPHSGAAVRDLAFSRDGRRLATVGADGHLRVWIVPPARQEPH